MQDLYTQITQIKIWIIYCFKVKSHYYDDQKSTNVIITESNDLEMTVSENHDRKS